MKYIGSDYTISRSMKFGVNFLIGKGLLAARRIGIGSGFEHARGTPLPPKASNPPPPRSFSVVRIKRCAHKTGGSNLDRYRIFYYLRY